MGILDDAIRQHLDLKRRQGADSDELQRLEDEAFGPPSRPGEPDFPDQAGEVEAAEAKPPVSESVAVEEPPAEAPAAEAAAPEAPAAEPSEPATGEDELELDLDLEEEIETRGAAAAASPATDERPAVEPEPEPSEPPIESLDTVEHQFEEAIPETGESEVVEETGESEIAEETGEEEVIEDTGEAEVVEGEIADPPAEGEDEDVLEETPEFLRDAPEDDELWFEQGEPKDFDF